MQCISGRAIARRERSRIRQDGAAPVQVEIINDMNEDVS
jgi:hypothetical protein